MKELKSTVRLDSVKSVYGGKQFSIRAKEALENGFVVKLGDLEKGNTDVYEMETPKAKDSVVLIANPALIRDNARLGADQEKYYSMEKNEVVRAYELAERDIFSVSKLGVEGDAKEGEYLVTGAGLKLVPSAAPVTEGFCAKVVRFDRIGGSLALNLDHEPLEYVVLDVLNV